MDKTKDCLIGKGPEAVRGPKIVLEGVLNYNFGKNGPGLTDELIQIGELVKLLSKDNYVYLDDAFVDTLDDVYDLKFRIIPHEFNAWMGELTPT